MNKSGTQPRPLLAVILFSSLIFLLASPGVFAFTPTPASATGPGTLSSKTFVSAPPTGTKGPDDITLMAIDGHDGERTLVWTNYQNGINPDGTPGTAGGPTKSTIAGYDLATGALVMTFQVTGKVDGLTADPELGALIATVNEDSHSAIDLVYPETGAVVTYAFSPSPEVASNGGTDSIAVSGNQVYVVHSNPNDAAQPTEYRVHFDKSTLTAKLTPVFYDNSMGTDALTGATVKLALTDPDTSFFMPRASPRFGGALATIGQADGQIVFATRLGHNPHLKVLTITDNKPGNVPPTDGLAVATSRHGTLYVVDASASKIYALDTTGWPAGTVFIGEPKDQGNPIVGTLNLFTGKITPLGNSFVSPKGLLFVPSDEGDDHGEHGDAQGPLASLAVVSLAASLALISVPKVSA
ncbi:MAG: hypothetical protein OK452_08175 [Thaumarchaeota archaeon]|nr:hypothetical protein [Nitrososphaerota archaeon]